MRLLGCYRLLGSSGPLRRHGLLRSLGPLGLLILRRLRLRSYGLLGSLRLISRLLRLVLRLLGCLGLILRLVLRRSLNWLLRSLRCGLLGLLRCLRSRLVRVVRIVHSMED